MEKIKIIFIGTPDFAIPALNSLINDDFFVNKMVITKPDAYFGREQTLISPPVKELASKHNIPVLQPQKINQIIDQIREMQPDLIVVAAYSQIISEQILNLPKYGCINIHGSLLPKYRGASCVQAAIINNEDETGITIMLMDKNLDTGPIIFQEKIAIEKNDTGDTLYYKLAELGGKTIIPTLKRYLKEELKPIAQKNELSSYSPILKKEDGLINWNKSAKEIELFIRAMYSWPGAWTWIKGKQLKIISAQHATIEINSQKSGKTFLYNNGLAIQCGLDAIIIKRLKLEGKKEMEATDFIRGQKDFIGSILG